MMNRLIEYLWVPLTEVAFQKGLIGGCLVAAVCGVIGCFVILRRMAFLGDALSHAMLAGVTAGYLFMQIVFGIEAHAPAMMVGSVIAGLVTVSLIGFVSKVSRVKDDTAIGIMYTGIFAVGGVLASIFSHRIHIDLYHFVTGMVLGVEDADLWMMAIIASSVLAIVILFFRQFQITTFDPVMAASLGIPVVAFDYLLTTCTSLVVVGAVSIVGVILVVGLLVTPAATAYLLSDRLHRMMWLAALFGMSGVVIGLYVSAWIGNVATGPSIVIASTLQFLVVLVVAPRYGLLADWLRRRAHVPQQVMEDILGSFRYSQQNRLAIAEINTRLPNRREAIPRALRAMLRDGLLETDRVHVTLTEAGQREYSRLVRAHRLWETYLDHVGTHADKLHTLAHKLEHVHDDATIYYLDDKLGHPLTDPHGAEIPASYRQLAVGAEVNASLLRPGRRAEVLAVQSLADGTGLKPGQVILAGPRSADGKSWTFVLSNQQVVTLDHDTADAVAVRILDGSDE